MQQAFYYYEQNKQGLGIRFLDALEKQFERVQKYPEQFYVYKCHFILNLNKFRP